MTRIIVKELIWDAWNIEHIKKHGVTQEEIIVSIRNVLFHKHGHSERYLTVGRSGKRIITVILRRKKPTVYYYIVTARDANKKERRDLYEKEKKSNSK